MSKGTRAGLRKVLGAVMGAVLASASFASAFNFAAATPEAAAAAASQETRAQFVEQLGQALCLEPTNDAPQTFSDVSTSDPDFGYIMAASAQGWISGFPDGTFQPQGSLTREQMAKVEIVALGLQTEAQALNDQQPNYADAGSIGKWAWGYVNEATNIGILQGFADGSFGPTQTFTTDQASDALKELTSYLAAHTQPTVTAVAPSTGAGGTSVTISGAGLCGATAVSFGTQAATSFTVNSLNSITAIAPAGSGTVDVTVTTPEGTSATGAADQFAYAVSGGGAAGGGGSPPAVQTATPTINGPIDAVDTSISGTAVPGATVVLSVNGTAQPSVTADGSGDWTVRGLTLAGNDAITVTAQASGESVSAPATATVAEPVSVQGITLNMSGNGPSSYAATGSGTSWSVTVPMDPASTIGTSDYQMTSASMSMTGADTTKTFEVTFVSGPGVSDGQSYGSLSYADPAGWTLTPAGEQTFETPGTWVLTAPVQDGAGQVTNVDLTLTVSATLYVSTTGNDLGGTNMCTDPGAPCATVNQAVLAADYFGGDVTIDMAGGDYTQQILIDPGTGSERPATTLGNPLTGITLQGSTDPSSPTSITLPASPVAIPGSSTLIAGLGVTGTDVPLTISNLSLDGNASGNGVNGCAGTNNQVAGIAFIGGSGTVQHVTLTNWAPQSGIGCGSGLGVLAMDGATLTVQASSISGYGKTGIYGDGSGTTLTATGNTITGTPTAQLATNGIEVDWGATGTVTGNTVTGNDYLGNSAAADAQYDPQANYAAGVLLYGDTTSAPTLVDDNLLTNNQTGVELVAGSANIQGNQISETGEGIPDSIGIYAVPNDVWSGGYDLPPDGTYTVTVSDNTITGIPWAGWNYSDPGVYGTDIWVGNADTAASYGTMTATIVNNQMDGGNMGIMLGPNTGGNTVTVTGNTVQGFQRNGITVGAWYLGGHGIDANIADNTVSGLGAGPSNDDVWAQNGIETGNGATGSITDNHLTGFVFTAYDNPGQVGATDTAIMLWDNSDLQVVGNTITDSQTGITVYSDDTAWNPSDDASQGDVVENNTITYDPAYRAPFLLSQETYGTLGIGIAAYASPGLTAPVSATVEGNTLKGPNGVAGSYPSTAVHIGDVAANSPAGSVSVAGLGDNTIDSNWSDGQEGPVYAVHYDPNGATSGTVPQDGYSYTPSSTVTVLGNTGGLVRTGDSLSGWNTAADGSGTTYAAGSQFPIASDTTLYAMWTPELSPAPTAAASTDVLGDTTITASAASGDTLTVQVSGSSIPTPAVGSAAPTTGSGVTTNYTSGTDLAAAAGDYIGVYEVNAGGNVVAFSLVGPLTTGDLGQTAPAITTVAAAYGSASGTTAIDVTPNTAGDTFLVQDVGAAPTVAPLLGATPPGGATAYTSGSNLAVAVNDLVDIYEVNGGRIVAFTELTITSADIAP